MKKIEGPLIISIQGGETSLKRELHLAFTPEFIQKSLEQRFNELQFYLAKLQETLKTLEIQDPNRIGIDAVMQICETLVSFVSEDEINLEETIVIEIQPTINISNYLTGSTFLK